MRKTLIQRKEVGAGGAASIEFTNIPQTYTDLLLVYSVRSADGGNQNDSGQILFNGDSNTSNYSTKQLRGTGSATESPTRTTTPGEINGSSSTSNTFSSGKAYVSNYTSAENKLVSVDVVSENNATSAFQHASSMLYSTSSPITQISVKSEGSLNLAQYSSASLYGVSKYNVAGGSPKATGGIISYDSTTDKWVHVFAASGTFTPSENLTAEYLVVAGGGGGGGNQGGGGGAGGYRSSVSGESSGGGASAETPLSLTASTGYTVTVGGGGSGGNGGTGFVGSNSIFGSITSTGGGYGASYTTPGGTSTGGDGGSGGGGGAGADAKTHPGGSGTANQGYDGGDSPGFSGNHRAGGGGGAGAVGLAGSGSSPNYVGGNGGDGVASSITGSAVARAGGGGGSVESATGTAGTGGAGGGGNGAKSNDTPQNGTAYYGGGGGGKGNSGQAGNGGSGIVIVRYSA